MTSILLEANPSRVGQAPEQTLKPKPTIRQSLKASTLDGTFSSAFENIVRGVLISNFLIGLGAGTFEVGLLTSIPMVAHLLQPFGAYLSEKTTSRHVYCLWIYGVSRLLWLLPAGGIFLFSHGVVDAHWLTLVTMSVLALSNLLDSIGSASWVSWMAVLVPAQLRGRYFSFRRSLASLTALLTIPVGGWLVSWWMGGEIEGYGIVLVIAVLMGLASLGFQAWIRDVNPQEEGVLQQKGSAKIQKGSAKIQRSQASTVKQSALQKSALQESAEVSASEANSDEDVARQSALTAEKTPAQAGPGQTGLLQDRNFLILLVFLGLWTFGLNLCKPFFNFYLLESLALDVQWVTVYGGLVYGAYFLMIMLWGRLADRIGNRPVLMINCLLTAALPFVWIYTDAGLASVWLVLPLLHLMQGSTFAAIELCLSNIQLELAPRARQSGYFAIAAAVMGITGALGTTAGSVLAELPGFGLPLLFALSAVVRLLSITPLVFVKEERATPIRTLLDQQWQRLPASLRSMGSKAQLSS
ncbi:MAG: MFS transporter [Cyanobacteria bacterium J06597_16]